MIVGQEDSFYNRLPCDINVASIKLFEVQEAEWKAAMSKKPKLRFYRLFKTTLAVENYVKFNLTPSQRSITAQLRSGVLPINIETGRFRNIALENRLCTICNSGEIESEIHFLFDCQFYDEPRGSLKCFESILI